MGHGSCVMGRERIHVEHVLVHTGLRGVHGHCCRYVKNIGHDKKCEGVLLKMHRSCLLADKSES